MKNIINKINEVITEDNSILKHIRMKPKIKYPQPYSIKKKFDLKIDNEALESRVIDYLHAKAKYHARYQRSKQSRRER